MDESESLDDLFSELEEIQQEPSVQEQQGVGGRRRFHISHDNTVELIDQLIKSKRIKNLYFTKKKEFITKKKIIEEIFIELKRLKGRIDIEYLSMILEIDESIIYHILKNEKNTHFSKIRLLNDEIFDELYINNLKKEIYQLINEKGLITVDFLCKRFKLKSVKVFNSVFKKHIKNHKSLVMKKNYIYSDKFVERQKGRIRGWLTAILKPVKLEDLENKFVLSEEHCLKIVKELFNEGRIVGRIVDKVIFFPKYYEDSVKDTIINFLQSNGYIKFDYVHNEILCFNKKRDVIGYLQKLFKNDDIKIFKNLIVNDNFYVKLVVSIEDSINMKKVLDLDDVIPFYLFEEDEFGELFEDEHVNKLKNEYLLVESFIIPSVMIRHLTEEFEKVVKKEYQNIKMEKKTITDLIDLKMIGEFMKIDDDYVKESIRDLKIVPSLEEYYQKIETSVFTDTKTDRKNKVLILERKIQNGYFEISTIMKTLEIITIADKRLKEKLEKYCIKSVCKDIVKNIMNLKLLEYFYTSKVPEDEMELIEVLKKKSKLELFIAQMRITCTELNIYLKAVTKKTRKQFVRRVSKEKKKELLNNFHGNIIQELIPTLVNYIFIKNNMFLLFPPYCISDLIKYAGKTILRNKSDLSSSLKDLSKSTAMYIFKCKEKKKEKDHSEEDDLEFTIETERLKKELILLKQEVLKQIV